MPLRLLSVLFASIRDHFLAQASVLLLFQHAASLIRGKEADLFLNSRISRNFSRNWLGLNNLCDILLLIKFIVSWPTQLWTCWLKIFYWKSKNKKKHLSLKKFSKSTDYLNVKFYFSNACLNSVEHILFPSKKN